MEIDASWRGIASLLLAEELELTEVWLLQEVRLGSFPVSVQGDSQECKGEKVQACILPLKNYKITQKNMAQWIFIRLH
jgi:hypothetical protein